MDSFWPVTITTNLPPRRPDIRGIVTLLAVVLAASQTLGLVLAAVMS